MKSRKKARKASKREIVSSILKDDQNRRERILRAEKAITAICARENVKIALTALNFRDGRLIPQIQLFCVD